MIIFLALATFVSTAVAETDQAERQISGGGIVRGGVSRRYARLFFQRADDGRHRLGNFDVCVGEKFFLTALKNGWRASLRSADGLRPQHEQLEEKQ